MKATTNDLVPRVLLGAALLILGSLSLSLPASARIWRVTVDGLGDAPTIQAAIDSSASGDEILVFAGDYVASGLIFSSGKSLTVRFESGPEMTSAGAIVLQARCGHSDTMDLSGFRLVSDPQHPPIDMGCFARAVIDRCIVENNEHHSIVYNTVDFTISGCECARNSSVSEVIWTPGALLVHIGTGGRCEIRDCRFIENRSNQAGGAITIHGGYLRDEYSIHHCLFAGNEAPEGGAVWVMASRASFQHNTFVENRSEDGALVIDESGEAGVISNNIFYRNSKVGLATSRGSSVECYCNDYWQNEIMPTDAWCWPAGYPDFFRDPRFCLLAPLDYRLDPDSPLNPGNGNPDIERCGGDMGALGVGCGPLPVVGTSWGRLRSMFGRLGRG